MNRQSGLVVYLPTTITFNLNHEMKQIIFTIPIHVAFVRSFVLQFDCVTVIKSTFNWKVLQPKGKNIQRRIHNPAKHLRWSFLRK